MSKTYGIWEKIVNFPYEKHLDYITINILNSNRKRFWILFRILWETFGIVPTKLSVGWRLIYILIQKHTRARKIFNYLFSDSEWNEQAFTTPLYQQAFMMMNPEGVTTIWQACLQWTTARFRYLFFCPT